MPVVYLSHFGFCVVFALLSSIVLGVVCERTDRARVRYAIRSFAYFMITVFALAWLMYWGHR